MACSVCWRRSLAIQGAEIVTTQEMLSEFLPPSGHTPSKLRSIAARRVHQITADKHIIVIPQLHRSFQAGFALYQARPDKKYSLTDCISMQAMRQEGITEIYALTGHFTKNECILL